MDPRTLRTALVATLILALGLPAAAEPHKADADIPFQVGKAVRLPAPRLERGMPLMQALSQRRSQRAFDTRPLDRQLLGDLLWAAWGINRPELGKHTAPSARNWQDMEVYVVLPQGTFLYDAKAHALVPKVAGDLRARTGKQDFPATAPLNLVYVSDQRKLAEAAAEKRPRYAGAHAGFIVQNVYLFCASEGLATVVRAYFDEADLHQALKLSADHQVILAQTVGWPAVEAR